ncbi:MAG TPA: hypothetical protein VGQ36_23595 [Thermoanaerobaculia bacterium]|jgi:RNA polymerase sigma factor (sigma-70 family)|nr:hypothetical protein [Thermoanaerobaculia bacterium]
MTQVEAERLASSSDPLLRTLICADDAAARDRELERLIVVVTQPLTKRIVSRYKRLDGMISAEDAEDVVASINLRVVRKLRAVTESEEESVQNLSDYVATLTYNAVNDYLRRRYPQRTRLSNRLRYVLSHDRRLALWSSPAGLAGGLAAAKGSADPLAEWTVRRADATLPMCDASHPADALVEILQAAHRPLLFTTIVDCVAELWKVRDLPAKPAVTADTRAADDAQRLETGDFLRALWREISLLPPNQRKALLLNLRDSETVNVIALLARTGTAGLNEIAAAMEMDTASLGAIWNDLPLDDRRIGELLKMTRQQVINSRKCARERLGRRLLGRKQGS